MEALAENEQQHMQQYAEFYAPGVLRPEVHSDLVVDNIKICETAGVRRKFLINSMQGICAQKEIAWVRTYPKHVKADIAGMAYVAAQNVQDRMSAVCGALLRNHIDARIVTVQQLIAGAIPNPTVLLVPNFFVGKKGGGDLATWQTTTLLGLMIERLNKDRRTVLYISDIEGLATHYGYAFREVIEARYTLVG